jgi:hypothetical protein
MISVKRILAQIKVEILLFFPLKNKRLQRIAAGHSLLKIWQNHFKSLSLL